MQHLPAESTPKRYNLGLIIIFGVKLETSNHFNIIYWYLFHFMQVDEEFYFHTALLPSQKANSCKLLEVLGSDDRVLTTFCTG